MACPDCIVLVERNEDLRRDVAALEAENEILQQAPSHRNWVLKQNYQRLYDKWECEKERVRRLQEVWRYCELLRERVERLYPQRYRGELSDQVFMEDGLSLTVLLAQTMAALDAARDLET